MTAGFISGIGGGFGYVVPTSVGSKWFPDKRGLVVGMMVGGYGAGSGVFGPIASSLIEQVGWRSTLSDFRARVFRDDDRRDVSAAESAGGLSVRPDGIRRRRGPRRAAAVTCVRRR